MDLFVTLVREYLELIDSRDRFSALELLRRAATILPRLYAAGLELPHRSPVSAETRGDVESPMMGLSRILGVWDVYSEVFDPREDGEAIKTTLSDDLADIYVDLKRELEGFDAGQVDDAIWGWKFTLAGHCGDHIVDAMRAIHRRIHEDDTRLAAG
jgi:hypothetical protein